LHSKVAMTPDQREQVFESVARMLMLEGNTACADCGQAESWPTWASSCGVLVCVQCAGIHRSLGTHASRVRWTSRCLLQPSICVIPALMKSQLTICKTYAHSIQSSLLRRYAAVSTHKLLCSLKVLCTQNAISSCVMIMAISCSPNPSQIHGSHYGCGSFCNCTMPVWSTPTASLTLLSRLIHESL